jgi:tetratricopeptide (TPR) repeat protein
MFESLVRTRRHIHWFVSILVVAGTAFVLRPVVWPSERDRLLHAAAASLTEERFDDALEFANAALREDPDSSSALVIAGESSVRLNRNLDALRYFSRVRPDHSLAGVEGLFGRGKRLYRLGRLTEAEAVFRDVLAINPDHGAANALLAHTLQVQGRSWESVPYYTRLIQSGKFRADELILVGTVNRKFVKDEEFLDRCRSVRAGDLRPRLAAARVLFLRNRFADASAELRKVLAVHSDFLPAAVLEGRSLVEMGAWRELARWNSRLPVGAEDFPDVWYCRGMWAREHGQRAAAVRCLLEAVRRNPNHLQANYQLSQLFVALNRIQESERFTDRSAQLSKVEYLVNDLQGGPDDHLMKQIVEVLESLGRKWEAAGWCDMALRFNIGPEWAPAAMDRLRLTVQRDDRLVPRAANPAFLIDLSQFPLPDWSDDARSSKRPDPLAATSCRVRFADLAAAAGLNFRYYNSMDPKIGLQRIFETTGGGAAVLDFDRDGLPDLYFANGCPLPANSAGLDKPHPGYHDRLFRNLGNGRFADVTFQAGLGDDRFSQGVTVGDHNNDGFPDLYVCNLGGNRFYENNGDGTFREITAETGTAGNEWSMSALLTDLNGDGLPDLYVVNYLKMDQVFARACKRNGHPLTCAPTLFPAEQDRLYRNRGDGTYQDVTAESGIVAVDGKGLGIVAADFDGRGKLNLFIGNDTAPNFYFVNRTPRPGAMPRFLESAVPSGLAVNDAGQTQACMGIAADDADGDGRVDLFVTNFFADYNTLYVNQPGGTFVDRTRAFHLRNSSYSMLGFGTQFVDGELDGRPDLIVANGHVDQTFTTREPDVMPPQYFQNVGGRTFREIPAATLGPYFRKKCFGRSMARLDWNRDGRDDVCIVSLDAQVALLTNTTDKAGHFLTFALSGVDCHRDAVGTTVTVVTGSGRKIVRQLTAGDGYQCSNERRLTFGLGSETTIAGVTVRWISGRTQTIGSLQTDHHYQLTERAAPRCLPR